jgi:hypothetical protein
MLGRNSDWQCVNLRITFKCKRYSNPVTGPVWPRGWVEVLALEGGEWSATRPGRTLPPGKTRYPLYRSLGGPPELVWTGAENLAPTGVRSPDRPARSQSLYRLSQPGPQKFKRSRDKYLKIIYSINKNTLCRDHVSPSLLLSVCDLISANKQFVELFFNFLVRVRHVILWNKGEFLENRLCDVTYCLAPNELLSVLFTFFFRNG